MKQKHPSVSPLGKGRIVNPSLPRRGRGGYDNVLIYKRYPLYVMDNHFLL
jgi:hypothetical protein